MTKPSDVLDGDRLATVHGGAGPTQRTMGDNRIQDGSAAAELGERLSEIWHPKRHREAEYNAQHNNENSWKKENGGAGIVPPSQHWLTSWMFPKKKPGK